MALENLGRKIGALASLTAKKAGEQAQIAKLNIDIGSLEKDIDSICLAIGRYCYEKYGAGVEFPKEVMDYCAEINQLKGQIGELNEELKRRRLARDTAAAASPDAGTSNDFVSPIYQSDVKQNTSQNEVSQSNTDSKTEKADDQ